MLRWLVQRFARWGAKTQERELIHFLGIFAVMEPEQRLGIIAGANVVHEDLRRVFGWDLMDPRSIIDSDATASYKLVKLIQAAQRAKQYDAASAAMIWLHTLRASYRDATVNQRMLVGDMWKLIVNTPGQVGFGTEMVGVLQRPPRGIDIMPI